jgi:hypothetical protein
MPSAMQKPLVFEATAHGVCLLLSQPFTKFTDSSRNVAMLASLSDPDPHSLDWNPFPPNGTNSPYHVSNPWTEPQRLLIMALLSIHVCGGCPGPIIYKVA